MGQLMDVGGLGAFAAVYECGSINKAAARLYMSPQGLSKAIARLEGEVGAPLFARSHQGVEPTMYARSLYPKVKELVGTLEDVRARAGEAPAYYQLRAGLSDGMVSLFGLEFIPAFEAAHPGVELQVNECSDLGIQDQLLSGDIEIGMLVGPVDESRFQTSFLMRAPQVLMVSDESPLARKESISYTDLNGLTVCLLGGDYPVMRNLRERLSAAGATPARLIGVAGADTTIPAVIRNEVVNVSARPWSDMSAQPGLRIVPFEDKSFTWNAYLAQRRGTVMGEVAQAFSSFVVDWLAQVW